MQQENNESLFEEIEFDHVSRQHILGICQWGMIVVILAVVGYVISIFQALTMTELEKAFARDSGFSSYFTGSSSAFGMVITIGVGLLINFFLFRFCTQAKKAAEMQDGSALGRSFSNLKSYFMIMGILAIVFAALFVFAFMFGLAR